MKVDGLKTLQGALLAWYDANARELPWRDAPAGQRDPYRVWLSEILLQQTQVSRGAVYFERFLTAFPNVQSLAAAPVEAVLKLWEGAGYYARARNLHRTAQTLAANGFPSSLEGWQALPGVGRYTAGAIHSLTANAPVAAVDGNGRRVLARLFLETVPGEAWLWEHGEAILDRLRPGAWNEALIELGATVCLPRNPRCHLCPISGFCRAFQTGQQTQIPAAKPRAAVKVIRAVALLAFQGERVLLEQRPLSGLLGGLHGVPLEPFEVTRDQAVARILERFGLSASGHWLGRVSHTMTHRQIELEVYGLDLLPQTPLPLRSPATVALSRLDRKVLELQLAAQSTLF